MFVNVFAVLVAVLTSLFSWYYWTHRKILAVARQLPTGVPVPPLLGHAFYIYKGVIGLTDYFFKRVKEMVAQEVNLLTFWLGPYPTIVVLSSEDLQIVLNSSKTLERGPEKEFFKPLFGNSLLTAPVHRWKITRRHFNPIFHTSNLSQLTPVLNESGRELAESLSKHVGCGSFKVEDLLSLPSIRASLYLVFGSQIASQINPKDYYELSDAFESVSRRLAERFLKIWLMPEFMFHWLRKKEIKAIQDVFNSFLHKPLQLISQKKQMESAKLTANLEGTDGAPYMSVADACNLLQQHNAIDFTDEDMRNEIMSFMYTSVDTSRVTASSCLLALGANPDVQERLYSEIVSVVGDQDSDVSLEDIKAMNYLDQVLKETLRKFILVPILIRVAQEDIQLSSCQIPAGASVGTAFFGPHYNPKSYPNPEKFNPDNFSPERVASRSRYTYLPLSTGPRGCIGKNYSDISVKMLLVYTIRKYRVTTQMDIDNLVMVPGVVTSSLHGYVIELESRH